MPVRGGPLALASTLAWAWGILFGVAGVALAIPAVARNGLFSGQAAFHLLLAVLALALCYVGYGLRQGWSAAGVVAIAVGIVLIFLPLLVSAAMLWVGAVVNLIIVGLTLANWRRLRG